MAKCFGLAGGLVAVSVGAGAGGGGVVVAGFVESVGTCAIAA